MAIVGEEDLKDGKCKAKDLHNITEDTVKVGNLVNTLRKKGVVSVGCGFEYEIMVMSGEGDWGFLILNFALYSKIEDIMLLQPAMALIDGGWCRDD